MNDLKRRKRGFLAALLAVALILGTPGVTAFAQEYYYGGPPSASLLQQSPATRLQIGTTVVENDHISYLNPQHPDYFNSGNLLYDGDSQTTTFCVIVGSGAAYVVTDIVLNVNDPYVVLTDPANIPAASSSDSPAAGYYRSLAALVSSIKAEGGETHGYGIGSALPYSVMKALADNPDDVLVFKTDYKGYHYEFTIQVGDDVKDKIKPEIPWYGPYWLAKYFFKTTVIEKLPEY